MILSNDAKRRLRRYWVKKGFWIVSNVIAFLCAVTHLVILPSPIGERFESSISDLWFKIRGPVAPPDDVTIVAIDEATYNELKLSTIAPPPRTIFAELLNKLAEGGAKRAIFDLYIRDPGPDPAVDEQLSEAIGKLPTYLGSYQVIDKDESTGQHTVQHVLPLEMFAKNAKATVLMNFPSYGMIRNFRLYAPDQDKVLPVIDQLARDNKEIPSIPKKNDLINYHGPGKTIKNTSLYKILRLEGDALKQVVQEKTVLVGNVLKATIPMVLKDTFETPVSSQPISGVEIHANSVANLFHQNWIHRLDDAAERAVLGALAFILILTILRSNPVRGLIISILSIGLWAFISYTAFKHGYLVRGKLLFFVMIPVVYGYAVFYYYLVLRKSYRNIEEALGVDNSMGN